MKKKKSKKKYLNFVIDVELYRQQVMFHFGEFKSLGQELNKYCSNPTEVEEVMNYLAMKQEEGYEGHTIIKNGMPFLIYLPFMPESIEEKEDLIHEVLHVVFAIGRRIGVKHSMESEEFYTYLMGFLTGKVLEKLSK